jgi:hypothetical protein
VIRERRRARLGWLHDEDAPIGYLTGQLFVRRDERDFVGGFEVRENFLAAPATGDMFFPGVEFVGR